MRRPLKIVCRGSKLSLAQADLFRMMLLRHDPHVEVELVIKETKGDINQNTPLESMEGKDFFTQDIHDHLVSGHADFAVHSLKDVSGDNFFNGTHYAIIERQDPRDVAIFNGDALGRRNVTVGTSSPRRAEMAIGFLKRGLPREQKQERTIEASPIRGNVDTRLQKLTDHEFDGVVLAMAGLNRLLRNDDGSVASLLKDKRVMVLPLLQCPPAPGQGAIVVETTPENLTAVSLLQKINDSILARSVDVERKIAHLYGSGCHQQFGVIYVSAVEQPFVFAAGKDRMGKVFENSYSNTGQIQTTKHKSVSVDSTDSFFLDRGITVITRKTTPYSPSPSGIKKVWVSETDIWYDLAAAGTWVHGSMEGFGIDFIKDTMESPLLNLSRHTVA